jgi:hypothetical protein
MDKITNVQAQSKTLLEVLTLIFHNYNYSKYMYICEKLIPKYKMPYGIIQ